MPNPFQQRASEYRRNEAEFLATLAPSLFRMTLDAYDDPQELLSKTAIFTAPPGTGKTTLARFFQYTTLKRLMEQVQRTSDHVYQELQDFAEERGFIQDGKLVVCGARISFERDYRELALIGYSLQRSHELMLSLVGARAVLAWRQVFQDAGIPINQVQIVPTPLGDARLEYLGGNRLNQIADRATQVEAIIYGLTASFIPPKEEELLAQLGGQFYPLLAIDGFKVDGQEGTLKPLLMIDDAHWADRAQHDALMGHLTLREVTMARWILQRMEALDAKDTLIWGQSAATPSTDNIQRRRTTVDIRMTQAPEEKRGAVRRSFRRAAAEIASRYMAHIPDLSRNGITSLAGLEIKADATAKQRELIQQLPEKAAYELRIPSSQVDQIRQRVYAYVGRQADFDTQTIAPAMVAILLHRQFNRMPQRSLFDASHDESLAEEVVVEADADVAAGAQVHLWHKFRVPYLGGLDVVADLGTENVETFLQLAWELVRLLETQEVIRGDRSTSLTVKQQHEALAKVGQRIVSEWSFPHAVSVRRLVDGISDLCLKRSLEPNAPLGGGANAVGIEQVAFSKIMDYPKLAEALRFGLGYNAFTLIPGRKTKGKLWTILELGGPIIAFKGLTPRRGGFVPVPLKTLVEMVEMIEGGAQ
ncbi:hypothetical protein [Pinirhizobacter soli]|uniref:hypothetical protein n=1 Tax=Pinirhizobacter soli TaxID=2786953 RepID=UPI00202A761D|nr:hypothetical protein [Pinirhizobacter soli]